MAIVNPNVTGQKQEKSNPLLHATCVSSSNVRGELKVHLATFFLEKSSVVDLSPLTCEDECICNIWTRGDNLSESKYRRNLGMPIN